MRRSVGRPAGGQGLREGRKERWMEVLCETYNRAWEDLYDGWMDGGFCENYYIAIGCPFVCSPCSEPFSMLSQ